MEDIRKNTPSVSEENGPAHKKPKLEASISQGMVRPNMMHKPPHVLNPMMATMGDMPSMMPFGMQMMPFGMQMMPGNLPYIQPYYMSNMLYMVPPGMQMMPSMMDGQQRFLFPTAASANHAINEASLPRNMPYMVPPVMQMMPLMDGQQRTMFPTAASATTISANPAIDEASLSVASISATQELLQQTAAVRTVRTAAVQQQQQRELLQQPAAVLTFRTGAVQQQQQWELLQQTAAVPTARPASVQHQQPPQAQLTMQHHPSMGGLQTSPFLTAASATTQELQQQIASMRTATPASVQHQQPPQAQLTMPSATTISANHAIDEASLSVASISTTQELLQQTAAVPTVRTATVQQQQQRELLQQPAAVLTFRTGAVQQQQQWELLQQTAAVPTARPASVQHQQPPQAQLTMQHQQPPQAQLTMPSMGSLQTSPFPTAASAAVTTVQEFLQQTAAVPTARPASVQHQQPPQAQLTIPSMGGLQTSPFPTAASATTQELQQQIASLRTAFPASVQHQQPPQAQLTMPSATTISANHAIDEASLSVASISTTQELLQQTAAVPTVRTATVQQQQQRELLQQPAAVLTFRTGAVQQQQQWELLQQTAAVSTARPASVQHQQPPQAQLTMQHQQPPQAQLTMPSMGSLQTSPFPTAASATAQELLQQTASVLTARPTYVQHQQPPQAQLTMQHQQPPQAQLTMPSMGSLQTSPFPTAASAAVTTVQEFLQQTAAVPTARPASVQHQQPPQAQLTIPSMGGLQTSPFPTAASATTQELQQQIASLRTAFPASVQHQQPPQAQLTMPSATTISANHAIDEASLSVASISTTQELLQQTAAVPTVRTATVQQQQQRELLQQPAAVLTFRTGAVQQQQQWELLQQTAAVSTARPASVQHQQPPQAQLTMQHQQPPQAQLTMPSMGSLQTSPFPTAASATAQELLQQTASVLTARPTYVQHQQPPQAQLTMQHQQPPQAQLTMPSMGSLQTSPFPTAASATAQELLQQTASVLTARPTYVQHQQQPQALLTMPSMGGHQTSPFQTAASAAVTTVQEFLQQTAAVPTARPASVQHQQPPQAQLTIPSMGGLQTSPFPTAASATTQELQQQIASLRTASPASVQHQQPPQAQLTMPSATTISANHAIDEASLSVASISTTQELLQQTAAVPTVRTATAQQQQQRELLQQTAAVLTFRTGAVQQQQQWELLQQTAAVPTARPASVQHQQPPQAQLTMPSMGGLQTSPFPTAASATAQELLQQTASVPTARPIYVEHQQQPQALLTMPSMGGHQTSPFPTAASPTAQELLQQVASVPTARPASVQHQQPPQAQLTMPSMGGLQTSPIPTAAINEASLSVASIPMAQEMLQQTTAVPTFSAESVQQQQQVQVQLSSSKGVPFQPFCGQRGSTGAIVVEGYIFHRNRITGDNSYYRCSEKSACRARFVVSKAVGKYTVKDHAHPDHWLQIAKSELKQALKLASSTSYENYSVLFNRVCNMTEHSEAAKYLEYMSVQKAMSTARNKCFPRVPKSGSDFHCLMMSAKADGFRTINGEPFYHGCVGDGSTLFFVVPATLNALADAGTTKLFFDGTFKTKPPFFEQLFMAYAEIGGKIFPLAFMPTSSATPNVAIYVQIMEKLVSIMPPIKVTATCSDFELSLINACRAVFPAATHQGCLFHFKQAVRRHIISKIGITQNSPDYFEYRIAMQLPHLPAHKIGEGMGIAIRHIKRKTGNEEAANKFANYLEKQWLVKINPRIYSTYKVPITTNNAAESYHSKMLREIGPSPASWIFVEKIIAMAKTTASDIGRVQHLFYRREQSNRQKHVETCTNMFDRDGDTYKFLLSLNASSKNADFGCLAVVDNDLVDDVDALEVCILCSRKASITLTPCNHKPFCRVCAWEAINDNPKCPICGLKWEGLFKDSEVASI